MRRTVLAVSGAATVALVTLAPALASAAVYQVGPTRAITQLEQLEDTLQPGDVVELDGDGTYAGDVWIEAWGTADAPVTIRGIPVNGRRPVISGGDYTMIIRGGHWILENLDVTGGAEVCLFQKAADLTVRDSIVRDCSKHGILGADLETGNLFLQRVEVTRSGFDIYKHQVYVATDEGNFPGSVFRMEGCYLHDASGGINVKSRAERVELYGNWIGGAQFHELDLVGNQEYPAELVREDSDVVGNVLVKGPGNEYTIARVGGDGTGNSQGRHRFANNTMILSDATSYGFRLGGELESFELHNNVIVGSGPTQLWREEYAGTMSVHGTSNWMSEGFVLPDDRIGGVRGTDPGFVDGAGGDYRLAPGSALLDAATPWPAAPAGLEVPGAQGVPALLPFVPGIHDAQPRNQVGGLDIGAFELGGETPGDGSGAGGGDGSTTGSSGSGGAGGGDDATSGSGPSGGTGASDPGSDGGLGDDDGPTGADGAVDGDDGDDVGGDDADDAAAEGSDDEGGDLVGTCSAGGAVAPGHAGFALTWVLALLAAAGRRRRRAA